MIVSNGEKFYEVYCCVLLFLEMVFYEYDYCCWIRNVVMVVLLKIELYVNDFLVNDMI